MVVSLMADSPQANSAHLQVQQLGQGVVDEFVQILVGPQLND